MAATQQQPNIWAQVQSPPSAALLNPSLTSSILKMDYTPPRGPCSQKTSMVSTCACYRFMIHPLKAATSFDCDGCGHHASFHRMEGKEEEEVARRWKLEEASRQKAQARAQDMFASVAAPKRRRIADVPEEILEWAAESEQARMARREGAATAGGRMATAKGTKRKAKD